METRHPSDVWEGTVDKDGGERCVGDFVRKGKCCLQICGLGVKLAYEMMDGMIFAFRYVTWEEWQLPGVGIQNGLPSDVWDNNSNNNNNFYFKLMYNHTQ